MPLLLAAALAVALNPVPSSVAALEKYFNEEVAERRTPSVSVAIVKDGKIAYARAFGYADLENDVPATPETVYRLGSVTKQFTATMIMQLVNEGKLSLREPVLDILPNSPKIWSKVTVRNLLNHTSGIKSYTELPNIFTDKAMKPTTPTGIIETIADKPLDFSPGTGWHYDNSGYEVLGMIIEKLDGRPYSASLSARILKPLGMSHTYFTSEKSLVKRRAQGYSPVTGGFQHAPYLNMDWPYAAGSMESTVLDLAKWDAALYGSAILPQSALKQMWTKTVLANGKTQDYGFGWEIGTQNGFPTVSHGGGIHGFTSDILRVPSLRETVIVLSNSDSADSGTYANVALSDFDPRLKTPPAKTIPDKDPTETKFAREVVKSIVEDTVDRSKLTPQFSKLVTPAMEKGAKEQLGAFGPINDFSLISSQTKDGIKTRVYHLTLGTKEFTVTVVRDKAGLIAGLSLQ